MCNWKAGLVCTAALLGGGFSAYEKAPEVLAHYGIVDTVQYYQDHVDACVMIQMKDRNLDGLRTVGSGFFITEDGYLLTNWHVVNAIKERSATRGIPLYYVGTAKGETYEAQLVFSDKESDVALLKIEVKDKQNTLLLESTPYYLRGERVFTIGHYLQNQYVFSVGYTAGWRDMSYMGDGKVHHVLLIDLAMHHGSSGGPLMNIHGRVIGMTSCGGFDKDGGVLYIQGARTLDEQLKALQEGFNNLGLTSQTLKKALRL